MDELEKIRSKIEKKFQIILMMFLFFPVTLEAVFDLVPNAEKSVFSKNIAMYGLIVGLVFLNYLFFNHLSEKSGRRALRFTNSLLTLLALAFVGVLFCISTIGRHVGGFPVLDVYTVSMYIVLYLPMLQLAWYLLYWAENLGSEIKADIVAKKNGSRRWKRHVARAFIYDAEGAGGHGLFLIAKGRIPPRMWHLPGGGIGSEIAEENGSKRRQKETPENALRRELLEELCLGRDQIESLAWVGQRASRVAWVPHLEELFLVRVKAGLSKQPVRKSWELLDAKWVDAAEFERLLGPMVTADGKNLFSLTGLKNNI